MNDVAEIAASDLLGEIALECEFRDAELKEIRESDELDGDDVSFRIDYEAAHQALARFRLLFSDEIKLSNGQTIISGNPFKTMALVREIGSRYKVEGPELLSFTIKNWFHMYELASDEALPMLPGMGVKQSFRWRGTKLGSLFRSQLVENATSQRQIQGNTLVINILSTALTRFADKKGLSEETSMAGGITVSLMLAWFDSKARQEL